MIVAKGKHRLVADSTTPTIAVVGDSATDVDALEALILEEGFRLYAHEGRDDETVAPDAVLMDVGDAIKTVGVEARLAECRARWQAPILCLYPLTERLQPQTIAAMGADDFLLKPVRLLELGNRLRVMLQRHRATHGAPVVDRRRHSRRREDRRSEQTAAPASGRCLIDEASKTVILDGRELNLSPREYEVFRLLRKNVGRILSAEEIVEQVWEDAKRASASDVHQYMHLLRRKVEIDPNSPQWIITVRGFGYKLVIPEA